MNVKLKYNKTLDIATAIDRKAPRWKNTRVEWETFVNRLSKTKRTTETVNEYRKMAKPKQDAIKDVGGFVGGYIKEGLRKRGNIKHRQLICLDVDNTYTLDAWRNFRVMEFAACMYTTHKHTPEKPRYRIIIPLAEAVPSEQYEPIARTIASWCGIDDFDDTTYQDTRLMYYPSTSVNGEFLFDVIDMPFLVGADVLDELPDWQDATCWATSSREKEVLQRHTTDKAEDPREKSGLIGAFCRVYDIQNAIDTFLSDVYEPCPALGKNRYTFVGGSTAGGLIVYNDVWAYSHHSTDPAQGMLLNAFDLCRLHLFGTLDMPEKTKGKELLNYPSARAMIDFAQKLKPVKRELLNARKRDAADDYDEIKEQAKEKAQDDEWVEQLEIHGKRGDISSTINNVVIILNNDENLKGRFGFNEFEQRETAIKPLMWDKDTAHKYPRPLADADDAELRLYFENRYGVTGKSVIADGLTIVLRANSYHPVRDYLDVLEWDGVPRIDTLFIDIFGAKDTPYTRAITRKTLTAAVARIYSPGVKFDYVLTLIGQQGQGKSTTLKRLGREWFNESLEVITGKEAMEQIQGAWINELAELDALKKAELSAVKHFISKCEDRFRVAYGKRVEHFPRSCIFIGTTNEDDFLRDVTGNRRFWVLNVKGCEGLAYWNDYLTTDVVNQLWAEAKHFYTKGEPLYLENHLEADARKIQDEHLEKDDRAGLIKDYLDRLLPPEWDDYDVHERRAWLDDSANVGTDKREKVCILEIWAECLQQDRRKITRRDSYELIRIMKTIKGWMATTNARRFKIYGQQKAYLRYEK